MDIVTFKDPQTEELTFYIDNTLTDPPSHGWLSLHLALKRRDASAKYTYANYVPSGEWLFVEIEVSGSTDYKLSIPKYGSRSINDYMRVEPGTIKFGASMQNGHYMIK